MAKPERSFSGADSGHSLQQHTVPAERLKISEKTSLVIEVIRGCGKIVDALAAFFRKTIGQLVRIGLELIGLYHLYQLWVHTSHT